MGITIVVGGQFGGEGKGKVSHFLAKEKNINISVRVGGSNSGHTVANEKNELLLLRQLPTPSILPNSVSVLAAGFYIDKNVLLNEIKQTGISEKQLLIDENAVVIASENKNCEIKSDLKQRIGSTLSGTGSAIVDRINRNKTLQFAKDCDELKPYITNTKEYLYKQLKSGKDVLIEGTQGFGLSVLHTPFYPYATSRDTTAAGFLSEVGLSPFHVDEIVLVIRSYPIRVEGNSGPLVRETSWEKINTPSELSSVTKKIRRVGEFDSEIARQAIVSNTPTKIVLNHLDYIPEKERASFIQKVEAGIGQRIDYVGLSNIELERNL